MERINPWLMERINPSVDYDDEPVPQGSGPARPLLGDGRGDRQSFSGCRGDIAHIFKPSCCLKLLLLRMPLRSETQAEEPA
jgi:hypothetical protein